MTDLPKKLQAPLPCRELAKEIRRVEKEKKWTSAQALKYFGIAPATMHRWEAGLGGPNIDSYFRGINKLEEVKTLKKDPPNPAPGKRGRKPKSE